ncbi:hypothetical protein K438DRAFT_1720588 [Mycena galopus ATCC 62051]|nr:hypothetical protein K438DRAFT_1720588 [Mycena galopus ATCC 62051]
MPNDTKFPCIAIVNIPGKGKGVVAKEFIPSGTLIISERPRIAIPVAASNPQHLQTAIAFLSTLSQEDHEFFLSFPHLPSENSITGRLKHFIPCVGDDAFGLFPTICRLNHTCYSPKGSPNAAYFWNIGTKEEDLRAIKEIYEGQEIEVSYRPAISAYKPPPAYFRTKFGFECLCKGCTRPAAERHASDQRILAYNTFVPSIPDRMYQDDPLALLNDIEAQLLIVCEEGYLFETAGRADDAFEICALYGDADSARQWEEICRDRFAIAFGTDSADFKGAQRRVSRPQDYAYWQRLGRRSLRGPSTKVLEYCYPRTARAVVSMSDVHSRPVASMVGLCPRIRCRDAIPCPPKQLQP